MPARLSVIHAPPTAPMRAAHPIDPALLVEQMESAIFVVQDERLCYVNPKLVALLGYPNTDALCGQHADVTVAPEDRPKVAEQRRQRAAGVPGRPFDAVCQRHDGSRFDGRLHGRGIVLDGRPALLVTLVDVSELKQALQAAARLNALLGQTEQLALIGSSEYDVQTGAVMQSAGMFSIFGEPPSSAPVDGEWLMQRLPAADEPMVRRILTGLRAGEPRDFEHAIVRADGSLCNVLHRVVASTDASGRIAHVVGILKDVTAQRTAEQQLSWHAHRDAVTGLPNRTALLESLELALGDVRGSARQGALLVVEIGELQRVSDALGYAAGDLLMAEAGRRLAAALPDGQLLAHLGSGEYATLLSPLDSTEMDAAHALAQRLLAALAEPMAIGANEVGVGGVVGLTTFPFDGDDPARLLQQAQVARQLARRRADGGVGVYRHDTHEQAASRLAMEAALRRALVLEQFELVYQPQLDLRSGRVVGVEALLRWNDPQRGTVSPLEFIPIAEECGLIVPIGEWVLRHACAQNVAWQRAGLPPLRVAVNLSVHQLQQPDIARRIHAIVLESGLNPRHLGLEITESVLVGESTHVARVLGELKTLGIEISLDDFGTGYSNLNYLRTLPIDVVKIDRSLVHDIAAAPQDVSITRAVITIAHSLQMKVLAEGVETEGQLALLVAHRCDQMQGYYFSRPVPPAALAALLTEGRRLPERLLRLGGTQRRVLSIGLRADLREALARVAVPLGCHVVHTDNASAAMQALGDQAVDAIVCAAARLAVDAVPLLRRARALFPDALRLVLAGRRDRRSLDAALDDGVVDKLLRLPYDDALLRDHLLDACRHREVADENRRLASAVHSADQQLAEANRQLHALLRSQCDDANRQAATLALTRDLLDNVPAALIGVDDSGLIAYANAEAQALFTVRPPLPGLDAGDVLPAALLSVCDAVDGRPHAVEVDGLRRHAVCRRLQGSAGASGRLLMIGAVHR